MDVRPLFHPSLEAITVEGILHALSDPVRAAIYADIVAQECSHNCSMFLTVSDKAIPKSTLSQHFRILREAGLIRGERRGRGDAQHLALRGDRGTLPRAAPGDRQHACHPI
jgi:DNA-binding transcriptional ArsR family regulator